MRKECAMQSSVNAKEIEKFSALSTKWWDYNGPFSELHLINPLRIEFIKRVIQKKIHLKETARPLDALTLLDVGCGGGLLSVPMYKLGAKVTGIDPSDEGIKAAKIYAKDKGLRVNYLNKSIEDISQDNKYDVILAMDLLEHLEDVQLFLKRCTALLQKEGLIFFSTINKNIKSWLQAKFLAEYILRWVPSGTHEWKNFISPTSLNTIVSDLGLNFIEMRGIQYDPFRNSWKLSSNIDVNYIIAFSKAI